MTCFVFDAWYAGFIYVVNPQKPEIRFVNLIKTEWKTGKQLSSYDFGSNKSLLMFF